MADLLFTAKFKINPQQCPCQKGISYRALCDVNSQMELMRNKFSVTFVEATCCVGRGDLARDGVHLNRGGVARVGSLLVDTVSGKQPCGQVVAAPTVESGAGSRQRYQRSDTPRISENYL